jgi:hypothetical protein
MISFCKEAKYFINNIINKRLRNKIIKFFVSNFLILLFLTTDAIPLQKINYIICL